MPGASKLAALARSAVVRYAVGVGTRRDTTMKKITYAEAREAARAAHKTASGLTVDAVIATRDAYDADHLAVVVQNAEMGNAFAVAALTDMGYEVEPEHVMADTLAEMKRAGF